MQLGGGFQQLERKHAVVNKTSLLSYMIFLHKTNFIYYLRSKCHGLHLRTIINGGNHKI